ncbi:MAG TPA: M48 family metalloprotease [Steroidobacteraceae bacterium]
MRRLLPALAAALATVATVASADNPPSAPLNLSAPAAGSDLPDMGSPAAAVLSQSDEFRVGAMVARELRDQNALLEDPEVGEYLQSVGMRLASQSADGGRGFQFFVIKDPSINAFAVPGGFVFVHDGLVLATSTESELASVMAHEIAHVTQHHIARMIRAQGQQSITSAAAILAAILLGAIGGGQAIEGGIAAAQGLAVQQQINFTRDNEMEADRVGIGYLAGAGFDANSMGSFFETMSRHEGLAATYIPAMLVDHPVNSDRIGEARARAAQFPPRKGKDSQSYELIRERVRVLTATGDVDLAGHYAQKIAHGNATLGNRYGEALALLGGNRADEATRILAPLVQQHEGLTLLHVALAQAQAKAGHLDEALATFQHAAGLFPRNVPLTVRYAETLMAAGRPAAAHNMLLDLFNNVPPTPEQIRLTALAASAAGDAGDAYFYMGEYQIAGGDLALAAQQLQLALASPNISPIQRQRYQARLDEVRDYLASTRKRRLSNNGDGQGQQPSGQRRGGGH